MTVRVLVIHPEVRHRSAIESMAQKNKSLDQSNADQYQVVSTLEQALDAISHQPTNQPFAAVLMAQSLLSKPKLDLHALIATVKPLPIIWLLSPGQESIITRVFADGIADFVVCDDHFGYLHLLPVVINRVVYQRNVVPTVQISVGQVCPLAPSAAASVDPIAPFFREFVDQLPVPLCIFDAADTLQYCNARYATTLGYTVDQLIGKHVTAFLNGPVAEAAIRENRQVLQGSTEVAKRFEGVDGDHFAHWLVLKFPIARKPPQPPLIGGILIDVTSEKIAQTALLASEERYRQLFETHDLPKMLVDLTTGAIIHANPTAVAYFGYPEDQYKTISFTDLVVVPSASSTIVLAKLQATIDQQQTSFQFVQRLANGEHRDIEVFPSRLTIEGKSYAHLLLLDITARKQTEAALQAVRDTLELRVQERTLELDCLNTQLEAIFTNSADGIVLLDTAYTIQQCNIAFEMLLQASNEQHSALLGLWLGALFHPDDVSPLEAALQKVVVTQQSAQIALRLRRMDSSDAEVELSISPVVRGAKEVTSLVCIVRDVTERLQSQRTIAEERNLLRTLIDAIPDYIYVKDANHRLLLHNIAHARSIGLNNVREALGKTDFDLFPEELATNFYADEVALFKSGDPLFGREERTLGPNGLIVWASTTKVLLTNLKGERIGLVGITHEITHSKLQEGMLRAKIEAEQEFQQALKILHTISMDLNQLDTPDEFYRSTIEFGRQRLGFERLGLLLYDAEQDLVCGTYGTDTHGHTMSEHTLSLKPSDLSGILKRSHEGHPQYLFEDNATLYHALQPIGLGWNAVAPLWNGQSSLGWLCADNAISQKPASKSQLDIFVLYASTVGNLLGRKLVEDELRRSEDHLRESRRMLSLVLDTIPVRVFWKDRDSVYQGANRLFAEDVGLPDAAALIGKHDADLYTDTDTQLGYNEDDLEVMNTAQPKLDYEETQLTAQGEKLIIRTNKWPWLNAEDQVIGIIGAYIDVTERSLADAKLQRTKDQLQAILDYSTSNVVMTNLNGEVILLNQNAQNELGVSIAEAIGQPQSAIFPSQIAEEHRRHDQRVTEHLLPITFEESYNNRVFLTTKFPILDHDHHIYAIGGISTDITGRKRYEENLVLALQREKELNELKSRFVSVASHEFRTPLATILATVESLESYRSRMDESQINKRLVKIRTQIDHLRLIMDDVLTMSRMQSDRIDVVAVETDLDQFCRGVIDDIESRADAPNRITYSCTPSPLLVMIDHKLMRQAISNLLSNALKYSPVATPVVVEISVDTLMASIRIQDFGIGIPETDLKHLFEPFHRATNVGTIQGTGLGLTIAKRVVELHGGNIKLESEINVGTTFTLTIPFRSKP